ncbi:MAG: PTS IIA-like nitrogen regulatory protein PtsN [Burkholderiales bacterium]
MQLIPRWRGDPARNGTGSGNLSLIARLLPPANVLIDLDVASKKRVFEQAGLLFENHHGIARSLVFDALFAREKLGSTGLGHGIAIPHGRIKTLKDALGAFIRTRAPVPFDSPDGQPVNLIFVLLVPERATDAHLQILSELAQMFSDRGLRENLGAGNDAARLHQLLSEWQAHAPGQRSPAV